jgi:hypothetical protein
MAMANDLAAIRDSLDPDGKRTSLSLRATIDSALAHESRARDRRKRGGQIAIAAAAVVLVAVSIAATRWVLMRSASSASAPTRSTATATLAAPAVRRDSQAGASAPPVSSIAAPAPAAQSESARVAAKTPIAPSPNVSRAQKPSDAPMRQAAKSAVVQRTDTPAAVAPLPVQRDTLPSTRPTAVTQQQVPPPNLPLPTPAPAPTIAAAPRENTAEQIANIIGAYARALETLEVSELRRVYPSMSGQQRSAWEDFFHSIRSLKATLAVGNLQVDGSAAEAQVGGSLDYVTSTGATEHRNMHFAASLRRERGAWTLAAVR